MKTKKPSSSMSSAFLIKLFKIQKRRLRMKKITTEQIENFKLFLLEDEKSKSTVEKYERDIKSFCIWLEENEVSKAAVLNYKAYLCENYAVASVNSMLSSINSFFSYLEWFELRVKAVKVQKQIFASNERELTKEEYERLLSAAKAKNNQRLYLLMQTICSTGIRVSELRFITVESINKGRAEIDLKGKRRCAFLSVELCKMLKNYIKEQKIKSGPVFITKSGKPLDRSNIWNDMKKLCKAAGVSQNKVFPHNLRHLFARTYYTLQKDIVRLADILGHSSINTTRIYTMETGEVHRKQIQRLGLLRC
jgi:site-specific recombinase XerD